VHAMAIELIVHRTFWEVEVVGERSLGMRCRSMSEPCLELWRTTSLDQKDMDMSDQSTVFSDSASDQASDCGVNPSLSFADWSDWSDDEPLADGAPAAARGSMPSTNTRTGAVLPPGVWSSGVTNNAKVLRKTRHGTKRLVCVVPTAAAQPQPASHGNEARTTLVLRNLPPNFTRDCLARMLCEAGFHGCFDFAYLPSNFKRGVVFGYAVVNFAMTADAQEALAHFDGFSVAERAISCEWSSSVQGQSALVEKYRNSNVMHESIAEIHRPLLFVDGFIAAFPAPTQNLKPPAFVAKA